MSHPRRTARLIAVSMVALALAACGSTEDDGPKAEPADDSALYAAAREEGKVVVYMNVTPDVVEAVSEGFEATYPGVEVEAVRLPDAEMIPRLETELSSGAPTADFVENASPNWLIEQGKTGAWVAADQSPQATGEGDYDTEAFFDAEHNIYELGGTVNTFAWNTDLVPDGIEDYTDLLDQDLAGGKLGVLELASAPGNDFYIWLKETFGDDFLDDLGAQEPRIYPSTTGIVEALGSGEIYAANWVVPSLVEQAKEAGAPIDYGISPTGKFGIRAYGVVNAKAANPNAAQLFLEYLLSEDGQATTWPLASSVLDPAPGTALGTNEQLPPWDPEASTPDKLAAAREAWDAIFR
ncbi:ABC transporter substrate-binding protein [Aeromicrobium alkaliterrae]|uniref:Extracellular solute-binding protein n=1 Tax=Aeromicrobium alkaliterrae TaxID=302168 RepID=A0ABN2JQ17_9ACTN